jgi:hypothetical protein
LAAGTINQSGDTITIALVEPADYPVSIVITWPSARTVCDPRRYSEVAAAAMKLLAEASTALAGIRAWRRR